MIDVKTKDFNLNILHCAYFDGYSLGNGVKMSKRTVYHYEIEYFTNSDGGIEINGEYVAFESGSANIRKPGQIVRGISPYKCYAVCIDILGKMQNVNEHYGFGRPEHAQSCYNNEILNAIPNKIASDHCGNAGKIMKSIYHNYLMNDTLLLKSNLYRLLSELYHCSLNENISLKNYNTYINKSIQYIKNNYTTEIDVNYLANYVGLSKNYFYKVFKDTLGTTPNNFILNLRLQKARNLLSLTNMNIAQIGSECGFFDNVYFSYVFRREEGMTPKAYRNMR